MEQELRLPYDRKLSEAVWRRVLPEVSPFDPLSEPDETACCMAAPPEDGLARLRRLIDEEVSMARAYRCHARSAPPAARRVLLRMAEEEFSHGRTLLAAHYLMTGKCYQPLPPRGRSRLCPGASCCGSCTTRRPAAVRPMHRRRRTRRTYACESFFSA